MAVSWRRMPRRRAAFHASSWQKQHRFTRPCASTCRKWSSRIRWRNRCTNRIRFRRPIRTPPMPPKAARRHGWVTTTTIVGVQATAARMSQETVAAQDMLTRFAHWQEQEPESVAADTTYGNGEFLQWLMERNITPYMRTRDSVHRKNSPFYGPERFTYQPESNSYRCPAGQQLNYVGLNVRNRAHAYIGTSKRCGACQLKAQCTSGKYKYLAIHMHERARQHARALAATPAFAQAQRERKKVEALFAEL